MFDASHILEAREHPQLALRSRRVADRLRHARTRDEIAWLLGELAGRVRARVQDDTLGDERLPAHVHAMALQHEAELRRLRAAYAIIMSQVELMLRRAEVAELPTLRRLQVEAAELARRFREHETFEAGIFAEAWHAQGRAEAARAG